VRKHIEPDALQLVEHRYLPVHDLAPALFYCAVELFHHLFVLLGQLNSAALIWRLTAPVIPRTGRFFNDSLSPH
jgi:hypothetical protein